MEKKQSSQKTKNFFKKNVYYIIMIVCLLAIAAMVTVTILINNGVIGKPDNNLNGGQPTITPDDKNNPTETPDDNPTVKPDDDNPTVTPDDDNPAPVAVVFSSPVESANILQAYSMDSLVWHSTLKHYAVHNGIDYGGNDGDNVMAVYDGIVKEIVFDPLIGNIVTIQHNDKLTTVYSSLNTPLVQEGQTVKQGAVIGTMGISATSEYALGAHVHFSCMENGKIVDPNLYFASSIEK